MSLGLELRVLTGLHREARCSVQDGAIVGADPDCDVILADEGVAPRAAQLRIDDLGWHLHEEGSASTDATNNPFNYPVPLGPVWITIARQGDPWVDAPVAANDAEESVPPTSEAPAIATAPDPTADISSETPAMEAETAPPSPPLPVPSARQRHLTWPVMLGGGAMMLAVVVAISLLLSPVAPKRQAGPDSQLTAGERSLPQIAAALERLGMAANLHVSISPTGTVTVAGWVRDVDQRDVLAAALSQIWPMPAMRVSIESDALRTARSVLQSFAVKYDTQYQGDGKLNISGIALNAPERASVMDALRAQLPGLTVIGNDIQLALDISDMLAHHLRDIGFTGITLNWKPDHLAVLAPELSDIEQERLTAALEKFNKTYWGIARLVNNDVGKPVDSVPFTIRSVIGGAQPFIVLEDGSKILVGGIYRKYRLIAIENKRILFEGPRRAIITR
jgi:type III secretion protein D